MSSEILCQIHSLIKELEKHKTVAKIVRSKHHNYDIPENILQKYNLSFRYFKPCDPLLIAIIEELGEEECYPLYLDQIDLLPGQSFKLSLCPSTGKEYYEISWNLPLGDRKIYQRIFTTRYDEEGVPYQTEKLGFYEKGKAIL